MADKRANVRLCACACVCACVSVGAVSECMGVCVSVSDGVHVFVLSVRMCKIMFNDMDEFQCGPYSSEFTTPLKYFYE